jgi:hypothetical protein
VNESVLQELRRGICISGLGLKSGIKWFGIFSVQKWAQFCALLRQGHTKGDCLVCI